MMFEYAAFNGFVIASVVISAGLVPTIFRERWRHALAAAAIGGAPFVL